MAAGAGGTSGGSPSASRGRSGRRAATRSPDATTRAIRSIGIDGQPLHVRSGHDLALADRVPARLRGAHGLDVEAPRDANHNPVVVVNGARRQGADCRRSDASASRSRSMLPARAIRMATASGTRGSSIRKRAPASPVSRWCPAGLPRRLAARPAKAASRQRPKAVRREPTPRVTLQNESTARVTVTPRVAGTAHIILAVEDDGSPSADVVPARDRHDQVTIHASAQQPPYRHNASTIDSRPLDVSAGPREKRRPVRAGRVAAAVLAERHARRRSAPSPSAGISVVPRSFLPEQLVHRAGADGGHEHALRGPPSRPRTCLDDPTLMNTGRGAHSAINSCESTGRSSGVQRAGVLDEVAGHPVVLARAGDVLHLLAEVAAMQLGAALAGRADEADGEALVVGHRRRAPPCRSATGPRCRPASRPPPCRSRSSPAPGWRPRPRRAARPSRPACAAGPCCTRPMMPLVRPAPLSAWMLLGMRIA